MTKLTLAALALLTAPAAAEPFTIFLYETQADIALRADDGPAGQAYWQAYADYAVTLQSAGAVIGGTPLIPGSLAAETVLGGYFVVDLPDLDTARALAAAAPSVQRGGTAFAVPHLPVAPMVAN